MNAYINNNLTITNKMQNQTSGATNVSYGVTGTELYHHGQNNGLVAATANNDLADLKKTSVLMLPIFAVLGVATGLMNKYMNGSYESTFLGKLYTLGSKIENNIIYSNTLGKFFGGIKSGLSWLNKNVVEKSTILKYVKNPVMPVWGLAKTNAQGIGCFAGTDFKTLIDDFVSEKIKSNSVSGEGAIALFKDNLLQNKFGLNLQEYEKICKDVGAKENIEKLMKAFEFAAKKNVVIEQNKFLGLKLPKFLQFIGRSVPAQQQANKLKVVLGKGGTSKGLAKLFPKVPLYLLESLGNSAFGGKGALLLGAFFIAMGLNTALKQEKGDRFKSFAEETVQFPAFVITAPLAAMSLYCSAGLKYIGMTKDNIEKYRAEIKKINENNKNGNFNSRAEFKKAKLNIKELSKDNTKNFFLRLLHMPFRIFGKVLSIGLGDDIKPWNNPKGGILNSLRKCRNTVKRTAFGVGRAIAILLFLAPLFTKPITKCCHLVFGRPKHSLLDSETDNTQKDVIPTITQPGEPFVAKPLINKITQKPIAGQQIRSQNVILPNNRTYIPSAVATPLPENDSQNDKRAQELIYQANLITQQAEKILKNNRY